MRFISQDTYLGDEDDPLSLNLYTYCHNNPVMYEDPSGHWRDIVFEYISGNKLDKFAKKSTYFDYSKVKHKDITDDNSFVNAWNSMSNVKNLFLYIHGGANILYFYKSELTTKKLNNKLYKKSVHGKIYLFSCHGGEGADGYNIALLLSLKTKAHVIACETGVSYSKKIFSERYYARAEFPSNPFKSYWFEYYYEYKNGKPIRSVKKFYSRYIMTI